MTGFTHASDNNPAFTGKHQFTSVDETAVDATAQGTDSIVFNANSALRARNKLLRSVHTLIILPVPATLAETLLCPSGSSCAE
jgi:hypothetical protein